jgi:hypothetical protein
MNLFGKFLGLFRKRQTVSVIVEGPKWESSTAAEKPKKTTGEIASKIITVEPYLLGYHVKIGRYYWKSVKTEAEAGDERFEATTFAAHVLEAAAEEAEK